jgi:hypothetical protein
VQGGGTGKNNGNFSHLSVCQSWPANLSGYNDQQNRFNGLNQGDKELRLC